MSSAPLFSAGIFLASPAAIDLVHRAGVHAAGLLARHIRGDWPDLSDVLQRANARALRAAGGLVVGIYLLPELDAHQGHAEHVVLITESGRTTMMVTRGQGDELLSGSAAAGLPMLRDHAGMRLQKS
ncbi:hypothetical protein JWH16_04550 [Xanthomonas campestris pv. campestris]|uniref:hypothetical protein n=1 Tax=Xanthomonas campestris TaxID=339 RepID=UPI001E42EF31|nr:hypothetical protein [Xanthomonas campestris]MCD0253125.1 hypothetical protein [Xanthomonas campestris pv. campestris]